MTDPAPRLEVLAHRGGSDGRENSIDAIRRAMAAGADGVEIDIQIGDDGRPVAKHDLKPGSADEEGLAALSEVMAAVEEYDGTLLIDFKSGGDPATEAAVLAEALDGHARPDQVLVSSFSVPFLEALAGLAPALALYPIVSLRQNFWRPQGFERWAGVSVLAAALLANPFLAWRLRHRPDRLLVWFGMTEWRSLIRLVERFGARALIVSEVAAARRSLSG